MDTPAKKSCKKPTSTKPKAPPKQAKWSAADDTTLIQVLTNQQAAGNQADNAWKGSVWQAASQELAGSEAISGGGPKTLSKCCTCWDKVSNQISNYYLLLTLCTDILTSSNLSSLLSNTFANFWDGLGMMYGKWCIPQMKSGPSILWYVYLCSHFRHNWLFILAVPGEQSMALEMIPSLWWNLTLGWWLACYGWTHSPHSQAWFVNCMWCWWWKWGRWGRWWRWWRYGGVQT